MAMRVVTLERLGDYIEDKLGSEQKIFKTDSYVKFVDSESRKVSCCLPSSQVSGISDDLPFLKFRDQVSGVLSVCGEIISDDEIKPYSYLLD